MAGVVYIAEAEQLGPDTGGLMDTPHLPPRSTWHDVEAPTGRGYFLSMASYLKRESVWPQTLYDPETDSLGQFGRLDRSGRALQNDGSMRTNRTGLVNIQVEVLGFAKKPFTEQPTWRPGPKFRALINAMRSWGIPDVFPMGPPPKYPGASRRDRDVWLNRAGHFCHANVPGNDHGDPGAISPAKLFAAAGTSTPTKPTPTTPSTPAPVRKPKMALVSKTMPNVTGDESATVFSVPPGRAWMNLAVDYVPADEKVMVRVDVSDGYGRFFQVNQVREVPNGGVGVVELERSEETRMVSVKRLNQPTARLDATLDVREF